MTEHVDELVKELKRKNLEKKRALSRGEKKVREHSHRSHFIKIKKKDKHIDEAAAAKSLVIKEYKDLHEVAMRVKGKK